MIRAPPKTSMRSCIVLAIGIRGIIVGMNDIAKMHSCF